MTVLFASSSSLRRSRGFSFTEIMFAVIVLGIGFIMIAAVFPVAIQQGKTNSDESSAANTAREALAYLGYAGANGDSDTLYPDGKGGPLFPATGSANAPYYGKVYTLKDPQPTGFTPLKSNGRTTDDIWNLVKGHLIVPSDSRYAFAAMYRRDGNPADRSTWSPFAQVWFIPVTARARTVFDPTVDVTSVNLQAHVVQVSIDQPNGISSTAKASPGYVLFDWQDVASTTPSPLTEGGYVIIADDKIVAPATNTGRMNGRIYHVSLRRPDLDCTNTKATPNLKGTAYDLNPDGDFTPDAGLNGRFDPDTSKSSTTPDPLSDDIFNLGVLQNPSATGFNTPDPGYGKFGNASAPATAFVLGLDQSGTASGGKAQDISAYTTFIKVN